ncbi:hypothetical protein [Marinobacter similis]|uniref:Uncharacterized protein n=1 Tax=Marinobacter similis TaxID=1420916 RepID=W5YLW7_9GAMM|nr:hypothetical protein [Marinobacter similis]AHI30035.1 hypothetical protein AU14_05845 [Marinobacter similis]
MDQIKPLPIGAQHYILMLIPRLIRDIEELGLPHIIRTSSFTEREVTTLYFEFVSINRVLPTEPEHIAPGLWPHLIYCVKVMTEMVNSASMEELAQAREQAIRKFLPHARQTVEKEYQDQCREGAVDLHLAGVLRQDSSPDHSRELCMEQYGWSASSASSQSGGFPPPIWMLIRPASSKPQKPMSSKPRPTHRRTSGYWTW